MMKKMKKHIIITLMAAVGILSLVGCAKESGAADGGVINIEASIGDMTKVSYKDNTSNFTEGDKISVYAWTGSASSVSTPLVVDGVENTFNGSIWGPSSQMLWSNMTDSHYFMGVYPARKISDFKADQFTLNPDDYTASDLLIATNLAGVKAPGGAVELVFNHAMARFTVNLKFRNEWDVTPSVSSLTVTAKNHASIDYRATPAATASGDATAIILKTASAPDGFDLSFCGLQVPQTGVRKITVTVGDRVYVYEAAEDIPLAQGKNTTLDLTVGKDKIEFKSVSVNDWTAEAEITGIETVRYPDLSWEYEMIDCDFVYTEEPLVIKIQRKLANKALEVPITFTDENNLFTVSADTVKFAVGEFEKSVSVSYTYLDLDINKDYLFSLSFADSLAGPGRYSTATFKGSRILEYEDYLEGWYSGRWQVNASITAFEWLDGPIIDNLDSDTWILQKAKGTDDYYKMIIWDGLAEIEFRNPGDGSFVFTKSSSYNAWIQKWNGSQFDWSFNHKGTDYLFQTRTNHCEIYCSGKLLKSGDCIELEGWVAKGGVWQGQGYNMYNDFDIK